MNARLGMTMVPALALAGLLPAGCARVSVDPIEIKPIHIVHDINIRVDRQLDEFFAFQENANGRASATQPTTTHTAAAVPAAAVQKE